MARDSTRRSLARVHPFFTALFARDASGRTWLADLLRAAPHGERLGKTLDDPGSLLTSLAVPGTSGRLACFEHPVYPPRELLLWYVDHPDALTRPGEEAQSRETARLRQALIDDDPPGARARAQDRAHERVRAASPFSEAWWRFEEAAMLDCILITDRLVVTVQSGGEGTVPPATRWYPARTQILRTLEGARQIAQGRSFASLVISEAPLAEAADDVVTASLPAGVPHLEPEAREELGRGYLGNLTWRGACAAVGMSYELLTKAPAGLGVP